MLSYHNWLPILLGNISFFEITVFILTIDNKIKSWASVINFYLYGLWKISPRNSFLCKIPRIYCLSVADLALASLGSQQYCSHLTLIQEICIVWNVLLMITIAFGLLLMLKAPATRDIPKVGFISKWVDFQIEEWIFQSTEYIFCMQW